MLTMALKENEKGIGKYYYCIDDLIYKGNKSEIYKGRYLSDYKITSNNSYDTSFTICVKKEPPYLKFPELETENNILDYLQKYRKEENEGIIPFSFVPEKYDYYHNVDSPSFLIEKIYGNSVNTIFKMCKYKFSLMSSLLLMEQMLQIIHSLHEAGIIHRNLNLK